MYKSQRQPGLCWLQCEQAQRGALAPSVCRRRDPVWPGVQSPNFCPQKAILPFTRPFVLHHLCRSSPRTCSRAAPSCVPTAQPSTWMCPGCCPAPPIGR